MKKRFLGVITALLISGTALAQDTQITEKQLPNAVKQSVHKYFGKKGISVIFKDVERSSTSYDIYFDDQTKSEIHSNGTLKGAENKNGLLKSIVPAKIQAYVQKNYPNTIITQWEKSKNKQEIKLSNDIDLEFDLNSKFLRVD